MRIRKLKLSGFKSFVEPAELRIEPGLTGVVGPNGCGKSNLVEALRWAMGETSHKSLRAADMDAVIFAGSGNRPARNHAEVVMTIDNADRTAPAAVNDRELLEISRRIEREAGSVYRINGRDVRARDVQLQLMRPVQPAEHRQVEHAAGLARQFLAAPHRAPAIFGEHFLERAVEIVDVLQGVVDIGLAEHGFGLILVQRAQQAGRHRDQRAVLRHAGRERIDFRREKADLNTDHGRCGQDEMPSLF